MTPKHPFRWESIIHALQHQYTSVSLSISTRHLSLFEVPSFTDSKDMIGAISKKTGHVSLTMPNRGSLSHLIYSTCLQNLATLASAFPEI